MNAKERRKLLRQQQQQQEQESATADAGAHEKMPSPAVEIPAKTGPMNAKERRKLLRQQQHQQRAAGAQDNAVVVKSEPMESEAEVIKSEPVEAADEDVKSEPMDVVKSEPTKDVVSTAAKAHSTPTPVASEERLNAKQRRMLQRKEARGEDLTAPAVANERADKTKKAGKDGQQIGKKRKRAAAAGDDLAAEANDGDEGEDDGGAAKKRIHLTLFVGQLPFKATEAMIRKHFAEAGEIKLRMLTDKKTKKFKGTAFIEVKDSKALGAALSRHHTLLNGRRINVELTASGGGNKSTQRREKIDSLRKKQSEKQLEKTRALVQKHIAAPDSKLKEEDVDERMIDFLSWFDYETAKKALDEYTKSVSDRVQNRKAFFMGILKRFRQTDGVE